MNSVASLSPAVWEWRRMTPEQRSVCNSLLIALYRNKHHSFAELGEAMDDFTKELTAWRFVWAEDPTKEDGCS